MMKWKVMKGTEVGMKIVQNEGGNVAKRKQGRKEVKEGRKEGRKELKKNGRGNRGKERNIKGRNGNRRKDEMILHSFNSK